MTCIVGIEDRGRVYLGGDSAGVDGLALTVRSDRKVFRNGSFVMGFTTSFRMGQLLRFAFTPPDQPTRMGVEQFLSTIFIDAVRTCLKTGGFAKKENDIEQGGTFLIGYRGRLFCISSDYQIEVARDHFAAVGSGAAVALGALHATRERRVQDRIRMALAAAERFNAGVRRPFVFVSTGKAAKA